MHQAESDCKLCFSQGSAKEGAAVGLTSAEPHPSGTEPHTEDQITVRTPSTGEAPEKHFTHSALCIHDTVGLLLFMTQEGDAG